MAAVAVAAAAGARRRVEADLPGFSEHRFADPRIARSTRRSSGCRRTALPTPGTTCRGRRRDRPTARSFSTRLSPSVARIPLFVGWPDVDLLGGDRAALGKLLGNLTWLGRAEGWVHAELTEESVAWTCGPAAADSLNPIPVFCADPMSVFGCDHYPTHDPIRLKKGLSPGELLFDCPRWHLCLDTETIHAERWPRVPGATWVNYARPAEPVLSSGLSKASRPMPTIARYSLDGPVLPLVQATLPLAEAVRRALMSRYRKLKEIERYGRPNPPNAERFSSRVFSGKDERGQRLQDQHAHAFYLPTDEDGDGRLDHVTVHASGGFPRDEVRAIDALRWLKCGDLELSLLLVGLGHEGRVPAHTDPRRINRLGLGDPVPRDAAHQTARPQA